MLDINGEPKGAYYYTLECPRGFDVGSFQKYPNKLLPFLLTEEEPDMIPNRDRRQRLRIREGGFFCLRTADHEGNLRQDQQVVGSCTIA